MYYVNGSCSRFSATVAGPFASHLDAARELVSIQHSVADLDYQFWTSEGMSGLDLRGIYHKDWHKFEPCVGMILESHDRCIETQILCVNMKNRTFACAGKSEVNWLPFSDLKKFTVKS